MDQVRIDIYNLILIHQHDSNPIHEHELTPLTAWIGLLH
jgi:hypothetical protein